MDAVIDIDRHSARSRSDADWEAVEREYRAGQLSVREIGRLHSVTHTAICKRARKSGWSQNLAAQVRDEVATRLVSTEVATGNARQAVQEAVTRVISLVRENRQDIGSARQLCATLVAELQDASANLGEIETAIEAEADSNRRRLMQRAISLPADASVIARLAGAMRNLVGLERQAFSLDNDTPTTKAEESDDAYRDLVAALDSIGRAKAGHHSPPG